MPYDKAQGTFFYKVSYKNSTPALPILLAYFFLVLLPILGFCLTLVVLMSVI
ncbi:MAG TPA: hypothetical protein HPP56_06155 [Nitrospirae bacterium]|nr:hypothetical protein [Nitrospirota bacterium]